jgi:hypothetical protein
MCDIEKSDNQNHQTCENNCTFNNLDLTNSRHLTNEGHNNNYEGCPPMMADGRAFTDYLSSSVREQMHLHNSKHTNHNEQRNCDINNGDKIIENINNHINAKMQCNCCDEVCQARKQNNSQ